ncbi:HpcH/HpaI aldolase/citrate lyase family protein [Subtercola boreus]|uniref:ATP/GTP-binding protein n=1 Tax=Subtercola boreus TaxID=120213 RepID=A0A3E0WGD6_9MICO|nr:HpcH/HpaI aldolase/citrate lyase family protein [Subtercola boreus]RFA23561.1 ATP/GTP-binding protein [Subtercola boreus]RFA23955.1 ATP/GTP-binding protein [Subtercola boreus]RFA29653.1 ATP/GTP-binding protein [Subtercola boreus]
MRHFSAVSPTEASDLFFRLPQPLSIDSPPTLLAAALGATLYCPGDRPTIAADVIKQAARGCVSMVLCLEDSIADSSVEFAETNVASAITALLDEPAEGLPLLFIRVRSPEQMLRMADLCGPALELLSGFVIPKFENDTGYAERFFQALHRIHREYEQGGEGGTRRLRVMPILESPTMVHSETRTAALSAIVDVTRAHREDVLAVRIGATDLSSVFGLRRSRDLTVYDVKVVSAVIADIVNVLGRPCDDFVITGPVWEHYDTSERILRPQLRLTPFVEANENELRKRLMLAGLDGLIREISLDSANGLLGKTVIHPTHVPVVHALSVVSHEEYLDAQAIVGNVGGGASASPYRNKMNEMKPHQAWAEKTLLRAEAFGVAAESTTFVDLLETSMR